MINPESRIYTSQRESPGQSSKYQTPNSNSDLINAAFKNPDGSLALVVYNKGTASSTFKVNFAPAGFIYVLNDAFGYLSITTSWK